MRGESFTPLPALWQPLKFSGEQRLWVWQSCFLALAHFPLFIRRAHPESYQLPIGSMAVSCGDIKQGWQEGGEVVAGPAVSPGILLGWLGLHTRVVVTPFAYSSFCHLTQQLPELLPGNSAASSCCSTWNKTWGFLLSRGSSPPWNKQDELCETLNQTAVVSLFPAY